MSNPFEQIKILEKELQYYKVQLDRITGNLLSDQYTLAQAMFAENQFDRGLKVVLNLQRSFDINAPLDEFFGNSLEQVKTHLSSHKAMILKVANKDTIKPLCWLGYATDDSASLAEVRIEISAGQYLQKKPIWVNKDSELSPFEKCINKQLNISTFIWVWLTNGSEIWGALLVARDYEQTMFTYLPYSQTEMNVVHSIGGVISACIHQSIKQKEVETERLRIARDMHDDIGAELSRITAACARIQNADIGLPELIKQLDYIQKTSFQVIENIGNVIWALNPVNNSMISLVGYVREFATEYVETHQLSLKFDATELSVDTSISNDKRIQLFRIVKESLHNIVKHAKATEVSISIQITDSLFSCTVSDNGRGISKDDIEIKGNGLRNMRARVETMAGNFEIRSEMNCGMTIQFNVPI